MEYITDINDREKLKTKAVELRESARLQESLDLFNQVVGWDKENANLRGAVDVLGHIRITYTRLADATEVKDEKVRFLVLAKDAVEEAINILTSNPDIPQGSLAIYQVHKASTILAFTVLEKGATFAKELNEALSTINVAIENLPGSKAHKAWPCLTKSRILYELGRVEEALETLSKGEQWLYEGYDEEMQNPDQGELKLKVWQSGLFLGKAEIFGKEKKPILALHYAQAVLAIEDAQNHLGERKKEAKRILEKLKE